MSNNEASGDTREIFERIENVRRIKGFKTQSAFCDFIDFTESGYTNIKGGKYKDIPSRLIMQIAKKFEDVSLRYILLNEGDALKKQISVDSGRCEIENCVSMVDKEVFELVEHQTNVIIRQHQKIRDKV